MSLPSRETPRAYLHPEQQRQQDQQQHLSLYGGQPQPQQCHPLPVGTHHQGVLDLLPPRERLKFLGKMYAAHHRFLDQQPGIPSHGRPYPDPDPGVKDDRICPICTETSDQPHQNHYGGLACFSCRAFWRRAHQKNRNPSFKCKKGGHCVITLRNRRRCQKCRYDLCIKNGMKGEAVLTADQRKVRFKNGFKKKGSKAKAAESSAITVNDIDIEVEDQDDKVMEDDSEDGPMAKKPKLENICEIKEEEKDEHDLSDVDPEHGPYSFKIGHAGEAGSVAGVRIVEKIFTCYSRTCDQMVLDPDFRSQIVALHQHPGGNLARSSFQSHIQTLGNQFKHFALMHREFLELKKSDQRKLLARNTPLYIQYILARYFSAPTGESQLSWILGPQWTTPTQPDQDEEEEEGEVMFKLVTLKAFNRKIRLFRPGCMMESYREFCKRLHYPQVKYKCNAILAHVILFSSDSTMVLEEPDLIADLAEDSLSMCPHAAKYVGCHDRPNVAEMLNIMACMARFFAQNVIWKSSPPPGSGSDLGDGEGSIPSSASSSPPSSSSDDQAMNNHMSLSSKYSIDEELWFQNQLDQIQRCFDSVSLGEDLMKEFAMYSLGVPMSKHFMPASVAVFLERFNRVMRIHPEFYKLSDEKQRQLCQQNVLNGVAMMMSKLETCTSGEEQLAYACGSLDNKIWNADFRGIFDKNTKVKKLRLAESNLATRNMPQGLLKSFDKLVNNVGSLMRDPELYKLLTLVVLFSDVVEDDMPEISRLRKRYMNILHRRQRSLADESEVEADIGDMIYSRFNSCVCDIKEITMIIRHL